ncbi:MAG: hypothetical protein ABL931_09035 [Usitatibacteraceae bacterium]
MSDGSFCVVFNSKMDDAYHQLLEGYLQTVPTTSAVPLMCAFCSSVAYVEPFVHLRLTQLTDPGHVWSVRIPSSIVVAIIDQSEAKNPICFQAKVDQLA